MRRMVRETHIEAMSRKTIKRINDKRRDYQHFQKGNRKERDSNREKY